jgi:hypothetical protein
MYLMWSFVRDSAFLRTPLDERRGSAAGALGFVGNVYSECWVSPSYITSRVGAFCAPGATSLVWCYILSGCLDFTADVVSFSVRHCSAVA